VALHVNKSAQTATVHPESRHVKRRIVLEPERLEAAAQDAYEDHYDNSPYAAFAAKWERLTEESKQRWRDHVLSIWETILRSRPGTPCQHYEYTDGRCAEMGCSNYTMHHIPS
jgi:hypothetical protein